jgi:transcriptional regulator of arginine metabolism
MKTRRQAVIAELVERGGIGSQEDLRLRLRKRGFEVTQATLSRDIKELGLVKRSADGAYQRVTSSSAAPAEGAASALRRAVADLMTGIERSQQLVVVRTGPGRAQPLALAIDQAALEEAIGTVAGDDTILVICRGPRRAGQLVRRLEALAAR